MSVIQDAYNKYLSAFLNGDGEKMAELAGARWQAPQLVLPFLGEEIAVSLEDGKMDPEPKTIMERILIYKYLREAQGMMGPASEYVAFLQLPYGSHHQSAFRADVLAPLASSFGDNPKAFAKAAANLGGQPAKGGDNSYTFLFYPKISLQVIVWAGDDEFPAQANVLFDKNCHFHMDTDGLGNMAEVLTERLLREVAR